MIEIVQAPQTFNFSLSMPDYLISSDQASIDMRIFDDAENVIISEIYHMPPVGQNLMIKLSRLIDIMLAGSRPEDDISVDDTIVKSFLVQFDDGDDIKNNTITVIKGFVRRQPFDVNGFLRDNWLNLVPQVSEVTFHQPLYLTAYPFVDVMAMAKARMKDGTDKTVELGAMAANKDQSVDLNPGRMIQVLGGDYEYFDVYTVQGSVIRNGYKRFYFSDRFVYNADTFLYLNRLGGWDTLVLIGERQDQNAGTISTGLFDEFEKEFNQVPGYSVQKNSGFIRSEEHRRQCIDFLYSTQRYHVHEGALRPIVLSNPELSKVKGDLSSFNFTFRYSDTRVAYPEIGLSPYQLIIE